MPVLREVGWNKDCMANNSADIKYSNRNIWKIANLYKTRLGCFDVTAILSGGYLKLIWT